MRLWRWTLPALRPSRRLLKTALALVTAPEYLLYISLLVLFAPTPSKLFFFLSSMLPPSALFVLYAPTPSMQETRCFFFFEVFFRCLFRGAFFSCFPPPRLWIGVLNLCACCVGGLCAFDEIEGESWGGYLDSIPTTLAPSLEIER